MARVCRQPDAGGRARAAGARLGVAQRRRGRRAGGAPGGRAGERGAPARARAGGRRAAALRRHAAPPHQAHQVTTSLHFTSALYNNTR